MPVEGTLAAAFLVGLLGGVHCLGMCGGIVGALTLGLPAQGAGRARRTLAYHLAYNLGRIASYGLLGALFGGLGLLLAGMLPVRSAQTLLQGLAAILLLALGLYLGGWWQGLVRLEQAGATVWRRLEPLGRRLLPIRSLSAALLAGGLWGWLPCGLVYSVLAWSAVAGGPGEGAALMLAFGLGTLPVMLATGLFASRLAALTRSRGVRQLAGLLVFALGALLLFNALGVVGPHR